MSASDRIFQFQTALVYRLKTGVNINDISEAKFCFSKPAGAGGIRVTGAWSATIQSGATASLGIISHSFFSQPTAINEAGSWNFYPWIRLQTGGSAYGGSVAETVYRIGE